MAMWSKQRENSMVFHQFSSHLWWYLLGWSSRTRIFPSPANTNLQGPRVNSPPRLSGIRRGYIPVGVLIVPSFWGWMTMLWKLSYGMYHLLIHHLWDIHGYTNFFQDEFNQLWKHGWTHQHGVSVRLHSPVASFQGVVGSRCTFSMILDDVVDIWDLMGLNGIYPLVN